MVGNFPGGDIPGEKLQNLYKTQKFCTLNSMISSLNHSLKLYFHIDE